VVCGGVAFGGGVGWTGVPAGAGRGVGVAVGVGVADEPGWKTLVIVSQPLRERAAATARMTNGVVFMRICPSLQMPTPEVKPEDVGLS